MVSTTINNVIKVARELFNELRSNLSREEVNIIRNELYKKKLYIIFKMKKIV